MERFRKFRESGDGVHLRIDLNKGNKRSDYLAGEKITEEYYDHFGFSEEFRTLLQLKKELALLQIKRIKTGERRIENEVNKKRNQIKQIEKKQGKGMSIIEAKSIIDKMFGYSRLNEITVVDFYTKLNLIEKENGRTNKKR